MTPPAQEWSVGRLLNWTTTYLTEQGSESPRLDAEILLAEARGCERIELYTAFEEIASEPTRVAFRELVRRRAEGTPVAYLVGHREFYSLPFFVTPDVLIPRPETEFLVVALLDVVRKDPRTGHPWRIADVGTGSGVLAVCAAKHISNASVTALDISPAALEVARRNVNRHGVADQVTLVESDLLSALPESERFDVIVSNPPYVTDDEYAAIAPGVREQEPALALRGGPSGNDVIERLIGEAAQRLDSGGWLLMELSPMIEPAVQQFFTASEGWQMFPTAKDLAGHARVMQAQRT